MVDDRMAAIFISKFNSKMLSKILIANVIFASACSGGSFSSDADLYSQQSYASRWDNRSPTFSSGDYKDYGSTDYKNYISPSSVDPMLGISKTSDVLEAAEQIDDPDIDYAKYNDPTWFPVSKDHPYYRAPKVDITPNVDIGWSLKKADKVLGVKKPFGDLRSHEDRYDSPPYPYQEPANNAEPIIGGKSNSDAKKSVSKEDAGPILPSPNANPQILSPFHGDNYFSDGESEDTQVPVFAGGDLFNSRRTQNSFTDSLFGQRTKSSLRQKEETRFDPQPWYQSPLVPNYPMMKTANAVVDEYANSKFGGKGFRLEVAMGISRYFPSEVRNHWTQRNAFDTIFSAYLKLPEYVESLYFPEGEPPFEDLSIFDVEDRPVPQMTTWQSAKHYFAQWKSDKIKVVSRYTPTHTADWKGIRHQPVRLAEFLERAQNENGEGELISVVGITHSHTNEKLAESTAYMEVTSRMLMESRKDENEYDAETRRRDYVMNMEKFNDEALKNSKVLIQKRPQKIKRFYMKSNGRPMSVLDALDDSIEYSGVTLNDDVEEVSTSFTSTMITCFSIRQMCKVRNIGNNLVKIVSRESKVIVQELTEEATDLADLTGESIIIVAPPKFWKVVTEETIREVLELYHHQAVQKSFGSPWSQDSDDFKTDKFLRAQVDQKHTRKVDFSPHDLAIHLMSMYVYGTLTEQPNFTILVAFVRNDQEQF